MRAAERFLRLVPVQTRERGRSYHATGHVLTLTCVYPEQTYTAIVRGGGDYAVTLSYSDQNWVSECSCPMRYDCKHTVAAMLALQQMWAKAGIRTTLNGLDGTTRKSIVKTGNWESIQFGMTPSPDPDMWSRMYTCDGGANWSNYCNKEMDKCMGEAGVLTDAAKRSEIYKRCQKILIEDSQIYGVFSTPNNAVIRKEVKGLRLVQHLIDMREVWLDK